MDITNKDSLRFRNVLERLIEKLKHKRITKYGEGFLIEDLGQSLNTVRAGDIITYILYKELQKKDEIYSEIIDSALPDSFSQNLPFNNSSQFCEKRFRNFSKCS